MHNLRAAFATLLCCLVTACAAGQEVHEPTGEWSAEFTTANGYVWRGFLDGGRTFQTDITYSRRAWEFCTSTEVELSQTGEERMLEVELEITRRVKLRGKWSLAAGYDYYGTPAEEHQHGHEFWTGLEYSGPVDFRIAAYQFAVPHTGNYFNAEVGRKLLTRGRFSLRGHATLGFNRHMYIAQAGFSDATVRLTPAFRVRGGTVKPFVAFSKGLKKEYFDDHLVFGMTFAVGGGVD